MSGLYRITITDAIEPRLAGHDGCHYSSPPQPLDQARLLAAVLLGRADPHTDRCRWRQAIAGGQRLIEIERVA
jgi:hypothetical protein